MEKDFQKIVSNIKNFITTTKSTLKETSKSRESNIEELQAWKQDIVGPFCNLFSKLLEGTKLILKKKQELQKSSILPEIEKEDQEIKKFLTDLNVDITQSLIKFNTVHFPKSNLNEVYIGDFDHQNDPKREGMGCLTDGKFLYHGQFSNGMEQGFGVKIFKDGNIFSGDWNNGNPRHGKWQFKGEGEFYGLYSNLKGDLKIHPEHPKYESEAEKSENNLKSGFFKDVVNGMKHECIVGIRPEDYKEEEEEEELSSDARYIPNRRVSMPLDEIKKRNKMDKERSKTYCSSYLYYKNEETGEFNQTDLNNIVVDQRIEIPYLIQPLFYKKTKIEWLNGVK